MKAYVRYDSRGRLLPSRTKLATDVLKRKARFRMALRKNMQERKWNFVLKTTMGVRPEFMKDESQILAW